jgi:3-phenylpropionate/trans-cinnamate dioxygenase ferredoxin component
VRDDAGELHAISDICSHGAVSLSDGEVEGCTIECWLHGSRFDLRTGKPTGLPATEPVATFPIEVRDGPSGADVYVDVSTTLNGVSPS